VTHEALKNQSNLNNLGIRSYPALQQNQRPELNQTIPSPEHAFDLRAPTHVNIKALNNINKANDFLWNKTHHRKISLAF
jgi:hypothetical protein